MSQRVLLAVLLLTAKMRIEIHDFSGTVVGEGKDGGSVGFNLNE